MALINCSECGYEFSDKAPACPKCGCPNDSEATNRSEKGFHTLPGYILAGIAVVSAAGIISLYFSHIAPFGRTLNRARETEKASQDYWTRAAINEEELYWRMLGLEKSSELDLCLQAGAAMDAIKKANLDRFEEWKFRRGKHCKDAGNNRTMN